MAMASEVLLSNNFLRLEYNTRECRSLGKCEKRFSRGFLSTGKNSNVPVVSVSMRGKGQKSDVTLRGKRQHCDVTGRAAMAVSASLGEAEVEMKAPAGSVSVVLLAGGVGKRMGANMPKQYLPLFNQPIALYSFYVFSNLPEVGEIVVVCDPSYKDIFLEASGKVSIPVKFAIPGKERQDSVFSGLQEVREEAVLVAVHDSARPLVTEKDTRKVINDALEHGAAVLGVPVKATIKEAAQGGFVAKTLDRSLLWEMQTPQVVKPSLLRQGFDLARSSSLEVTDDVSLVEHLSLPVRITTGSYENLKVTTPDDLLLAERILSQKK